ncbi:MAG TPA: transposase, partial [Rhodopila sp.]|nr:transposase [Rhodopila sp.]
ESRRWVETAEQARPVLAGASLVTVVSDREGDMSPLWARVPGETFPALGRVRLDRKLADGSMVFATTNSLPLQQTRTLTLPARAPSHGGRAARVELRFAMVAIRRSPNEKDRELAKAVPLTVIDVREVDPPAGVEAIHWRLLTTHAVSGAAEAWQIVGWYQRRWGVEQLFRILKTQGLRLEDSIWPRSRDWQS